MLLKNSINIDKTLTMTMIINQREETREKNRRKENMKREGKLKKKE